MSGGQLPQAAQAIVDEFREVLNDIAGTHHSALWGLRLLREHFGVLLADAPDPTQDFLIGHGDPSDPETRAYQRWRIDSIPGRLAEGGPVAEQLGQQWAVLIYAQWEHNFRPRLAEALGVEVGDVRDDLMGDIRHIRHDILHHAGVGTGDHCGRCKVLKWFGPGDRITITTKHVAEFMDKVGLTIKTAHEPSNPSP